ncbi:MAG: hypothetical protein SZ59_C0001G0156 [candidate division TM6 bacterium GW2011_GWF2_28_16]|nr:MAG: hypothetical protein SZ59_C0001G0156 [candidate division TM6 bacterium GW2011_GWF2_28_16]
MKKINLIYTLSLISLLAINLNAEIITPTQVNNDELNAQEIIIAIKNLAQKISPEMAVKEYFEYIKTTYEKTKASPLFDKTQEAKDFNTFTKEFNSILLISATKETLLDQAIYFYILPNELVRDLTILVNTEMNQLMQNINNFILEKTENIESKSSSEKAVIDLEIQNTMRDMFKAHFDISLDEIKKVFNKYYNF